MTTQIVTCRTTGCENENIEIRFEDVLPNVYCGACWNEITDKKDTE